MLWVMGEDGGKIAKVLCCEFLQSAMHRMHHCATMRHAAQHQRAWGAESRKKRENRKERYRERERARGKQKKGGKNTARSDPRTTTASPRMQEERPRDTPRPPSQPPEMGKGGKTSRKPNVEKHSHTDYPPKSVTKTGAGLTPKTLHAKKTKIQMQHIEQTTTKKTG